ncbi:hypothetical protein E5288_WYG008076 [Bos mutus]|uniref:Uncharacterized protein n=1 Tax=Bos mutus TaxID=72004 RepID=A0A6B0RVU4_9CETA|nr:hypothetical protein [Bos mutus]
MSKKPEARTAVALRLLSDSVPHASSLRELHFVIVAFPKDMMSQQQHFDLNKKGWHKKQDQEMEVGTSPLTIQNLDVPDVFGWSSPCCLGCHTANPPSLPRMFQVPGSHIQVTMNQDALEQLSSSELSNTANIFFLLMTTDIRTKVTSLDKDRLKTDCHKLRLFIIGKKMQLFFSRKQTFASKQNGEAVNRRSFSIVFAELPPPLLHHIALRGLDINCMKSEDHRSTTMIDFYHIIFSLFLSRSDFTYKIMSREDSVEGTNPHILFDFAFSTWNCCSFNIVLLIYFYRLDKGKDFDNLCHSSFSGL